MISQRIARLWAHSLYSSLTVFSLGSLGCAGAPPPNAFAQVVMPSRGEACARCGEPATLVTARARLEAEKKYENALRAVDLAVVQLKAQARHDEMNGEIDAALAALDARATVIENEVRGLPWVPATEWQETNQRLSRRVARLERDVGAVER